VSRLAHPSAWHWVVSLPVLWLAHLSTLYWLGELHCRQGTFGGSPLGIEGYKLGMIAVTLAGAALLATAAIRFVRATRSDDSEQRFAGFVGTMLAVLLGFYLAWSLVSPLAATSC
jgi:hypothetical protein